MLIHPNYETMTVSMNTTVGTVSGKFSFFFIVFYHYLPKTISGFVEEPLSLNVTIGEEAVFHCEHRSADAIFWRINGTSLRDRTDLSDDFNDIVGPDKVQQYLDSM